MKNILRCMVFVVVAFFATSAWAAVSVPITVNATVPTVTGGLTATVSKVIGTVWTTATSISFGTLVLDPVNKIFAPSDKSYFAVDVGVADNSGTVWTVTHTRTSLASGANNLNDKVNVTFVKQTSSTASTPLQAVSFGNSNNVAYNKTALAGGWLRIYYGLGTGGGTDPITGLPNPPDNSGVTPIGLDTPAGTYSGTVTITMTP